MTTIDPRTEFPVPAALEGFWKWDKMHMPRPMTPMTQEVFVDGVQTGFCRAMDEFACPVLTVDGSKGIVRIDSRD